MIPSLKDGKTRHKKQEQEPFTGKKRDFDSILQEAKEELAREPIKCRTNGYTKEAKVITYQYESKEYNM